MKKRARGRPAGGSEEIVRGVLEATVDLLVKRGYEALAIDEIARASGVNKTSVYRRWPTKAELVIAALRARPRKEPPFVETGNLVKDLKFVVTSKARRLSAPSGRVIARALMTVSGDPEMMATLRASRFGLSSSIIASAIERGELPKSVDAAFAAEMLFAPIVNRIVVLDESATPKFIDQVVAHTLAALGYAPRKSRKKQR